MKRRESSKRYERGVRSVSSSNSSPTANRLEASSSALRRSWRSCNSACTQVRRSYLNPEPRWVRCSGGGQGAAGMQATVGVEERVACPQAELLISDSTSGTRACQS